MRIKTQAQADALNQRIFDEMGVDISKYRNEDVASTLTDLLIFPIYAIKWIVQPVIIVLLLWVAGWFFLALYAFDYVLYPTIGLLLALLVGFLSGLLYLTIRFKQDIHSIMAYSTEILESIVLDVDKLNKGTNKANRKDNLTLLFTGVVHIITVPVAASVIAKKVPFVGDFLAGLFTRILRQLANIFRWPESKRARASLEAGGDEGKILPMYLASVSGVQKATGKVLNVAVRVVQAPIFLVWLFFAFITWGFIWLIN